MVTDEQRDVIALLSTPDAYGRRGAVERIDTHISIVWLVGDRAYKLKRAVRFDYVDFSTPERRRAACEAEIRLNRRTAPSIYLGVLPVGRRRARARRPRRAGRLGGRNGAVRRGHAARPAGRASSTGSRADGRPGRGDRLSARGRANASGSRRTRRDGLGHRRQRARLRRTGRQHSRPRGLRAPHRADAVCGSPREREALAAAAHDAHVPFLGLWLEGSPEVLAARLHQRAADASDATAEVLEGQIRSAVVPLDWQRLDGSRDADSVQHAAEAVLQEGRTFAPAR